MNNSPKVARQWNQSGSLKLVAYKCPSCNMLIWHDTSLGQKVFCSFCCDRIPAYVAKMTPEKMIRTREISRPRGEETLAEQESVSPFVHEFFMVRASGITCMAYLNGQGQWRGAFDNAELPGAVYVVG
jgi:hypothetical protein